MKIYGNNQDKIKKIVQKENNLEDKKYKKEEEIKGKIGFIIFAIIITVVVMINRYDLLFG
jgi:hypothetical protein|tara:strand:+ start:39 stop:218 length:180 start_codon:yes stop_codon:yes gene_type:complete